MLERILKCDLSIHVGISLSKPLAIWCIVDSLLDWRLQPRTVFSALGTNWCDNLAYVILI